MYDLLFNIFSQNYFIYIYVSPINILCIAYLLLISLEFVLVVYAFGLISS